MADVLGDAVKVYKDILKKDQKAKDYLISRGLDEQLIDTFDLGSTGDLGLFYFLIKTDYKYSDDVLEDAGLLMTNGDVRETFKHSIIIPAKDICGRVINITQRRIDDHPVKYLNLPHRPLRDFFGLDVVANRHLYSDPKGLNKSVFIAEGQFDTFILSKLGLRALGILGVNSIREQMFEHLNWFEDVILCFDNDYAGQTARQKFSSCAKYYCPNVNLHFLKFPEGINDVNEWHLKGTGTVDDIINNVHKMGYIKPHPLKAPKSLKNKDDNVIRLKKVPIKEFIDSVSPGMQWHKRSNVIKARCPFPNHEDGVSSFTVYKENNTYFCFGCGKGGDVIDFCQNMFDVNFRNALNILSKWSETR